MSWFAVYAVGKSCLTEHILDLGNDRGLLLLLLLSVTYPLSYRMSTRNVLPLGDRVMWKQSRLRPGDELRVKIVETEAVDKPSKRFPRDPSTDEKRKKRYVLQMAKQFGWKIKRPE